MSVKDKKQPYCLMPWIHFHLGHKGQVNACCVANIPYGNINQQSFDEIWNSTEINKLRAQFAKGEKDSRCAVCIQREKSGAKSIRQETFEKFPDVDWESPEPTPIYFDIRFSNICNFRCRSCWHGASSKWFNDAKALRRTAAATAVVENVKDFDSFIIEYGSALKNAREIYFAGGEPLVTPEHYLLLEWLINQDTFPRLRYNTNFSVLDFKGYDLLKLWNYFPEVEILASVDAMGELGEIIRKEMKWDQFLLNRERIREAQNIQFKIAPTVSLMNMEHLPHFYLEMVRKKIVEAEGFYFNLLERPYYYNIKAFPADKKRDIIQHYATFYKENQVPESIENAMMECLGFMLEDDLSAKYWPQFLNESQKLDALRGEHYLEQIAAKPMAK